MLSSAIAESLMTIIRRRSTDASAGRCASLSNEITLFRLLGMGRAQGVTLFSDRGLVLSTARRNNSAIFPALTGPFRNDSFIRHMANLA
jgi:hypothetical protein